MGEEENVANERARVLRMNAPSGDPDTDELVMAFAPLHKRAFGTALGAAAGVFMFALTAIHVLRNPEPGSAMNLQLLSNYFYGYTPTWKGAFVGAFWGFVVGFVGGWFVAFCRNLVIAVSIFVTRTRAELRATRDFLDHI
jgi:hypothetical protein